MGAGSDSYLNSLLPFFI